MRDSDLRRILQLFALYLTKTGGNALLRSKSDAHMAICFQACIEAQSIPKLQGYTAEQMLDKLVELVLFLAVMVVVLVMAMQVLVVKVEDLELLELLELLVKDKYKVKTQELVQQVAVVQQEKLLI